MDASEQVKPADEGRLERMVRARALLVDVLRAEEAKQDLHENEHHEIVVCAMRDDGSLYQLGTISSALVFQFPEQARAAVERIKFGFINGPRHDGGCPVCGVRRQTHACPKNGPCPMLVRDERPNQEINGAEGVRLIGR